MIVFCVTVEPGDPKITIPPSFRDDAGQIQYAEADKKKKKSSGGIGGGIAEVATNAELDDITHCGISDDVALNNRIPASK